MDEEEQFNQAFGEHTGISADCRDIVNRIKNNDNELNYFSIPDSSDAELFTNQAWKLFGRYIANNTHLQKLSLLDFHLNDEQMAVLFGELISSVSLEWLCMSYNHEFGVDGLRCAIPFFRNSNLLTIDFDRNRNFNTECFELLIRAIHGSPIKKLFLDGCTINDVSALGNSSLPLLETLQLEQNSIQSITALENYINLQTLNLRGNNIGIDGCRALTHLLQNEDSRLETLNLDNNEINDEGAEIIANSLKHNTKLKKLRLNKNDNITEKGFKAFLKLLVNVSSIEDTLNSNHTLSDLSLPGGWDTGYNVRQHIDNMLSINDGSYPGRQKVIDCQLYIKDRIELAKLQGITCPTHNSVYSQIDPVVLPDVLAIVGEECTHNDLYCALITTAPDLTSLVNKPVAIKEQIEEKKERIASLNAEYKRKMEVLAAENARQNSSLNADILRLNEELQSLNQTGVSNTANKTENTNDNDSGKKRRRDS